MKKRLFSFLLLAVGAVCPIWADCTSPAKPSGAVLYSSDQNAVVFCDGTNWRLTGAAVAGATSGGCSSPSHPEGALFYEGSNNQFQFCNGQNWIAMGPKNAGAGTGGCREGALQYSSTAGWLQYCDGDNWVNAGQVQVAGSSGFSCPTGFVYIPNSAGVDSQSNGWCVSKYEMTPNDTAEWTQDATYKGWSFNSTTSAASKYITAKSGQTPITTISRNEAATACTSYLKDGSGNSLSGSKLLTVQLWSLLAQDITNVAENWSGGVVGTGYMSRGFADNDPANTIAAGSDSFPATDNMGSPDTCAGGVCTGEYWSRTHKTSNGDLVWDLAGNVFEWYDDLHGSGGSEGWQDFTNATYAYNSTSLEPANTSWTATQGVGRIYNGDATKPGTTFAALFGGYWHDGTSAGVWASTWSGIWPSSARSQYIGFRCIAPAQ